jgi:DNA-directed RNA polymerase sigma subunit (sigma70/sigma32)
VNYLKLKQRELEVLEKRFFGLKKLGEIGREFKISKERTRQIQCKAIKKLITYYKHNENEIGA